MSSHLQEKSDSLKWKFEVDNIKTVYYNGGRSEELDDRVSSAF